ncbi:hypothetical protein ACW0JT_16545 [Arthrobacter sp. SA17]
MEPGTQGLARDPLGGRQPAKRVHGMRCAPEEDASAQENELQPHPSSQLPPSDALIPLKVIGVAHGILFLTAGQEHQERLNETAVEPATPCLSTDGVTAW